ncbi:hypothetical protein HFO94_31635 [Rhizobium leguminosarum]|uniref:Uncharacterized protein n=1 Tax=Rhizobium laguerreae TaxID=1076926 RepID=A0A7Y2R099_9HYPH|nr:MULTISPECIES: hypothetical protein [Rhizobium]MBY5358000.1 hypothetical protein [Rhizobium leguminosarum]NNG74658.1 hypothetical protein [Rhizobium laguerreae]NNH45767.1 hypothetical protein [Rhizobium laguerreae]NNH58704.1 hypothetical protein [Rhizobium laguerreae]NNH61976.1 hypothetical protein [Rhizobium laguerreae]
MTDRLIRTLTSCFAELLFQIEKADEEMINSDFSVKLMEFVGAELQDLDKKSASDLLAIVKQIADAEKNKEKKEFLEIFSENFGLVV